MPVGATDDGCAHLSDHALSETGGEDLESVSIAVVVLVVVVIVSASISIAAATGLHQHLKP